MINIAVSMAMFTLTFVLYVFAGRKLMGHTNPVRGIIIFFAFGFIISAFITVWLSSAGLITLTLPFSAAILYGMLSVTLVIISATPLLGDESPSSKIYLFVKKTGRANISQLENLFNETELTDKRLDDLVKSGWIGKSGNKIMVTKKGKKIAGFVFWYKNLLGMKVTG